MSHDNLFKRTKKKQNIYWQPPRIIRSKQIQKMRDWIKNEKNLYITTVGIVLYFHSMGIWVDSTDSLVNMCDYARIHIMCAHSISCIQWLSAMCAEKKTLQGSSGRLFVCRVQFHTNLNSVRFHACNKNEIFSLLIYIWAYYTIESSSLSFFFYAQKRHGWLAGFWFGLSIPSRGDFLFFLLLNFTVGSSFCSFFVLFCSVCFFIHRNSIATTISVTHYELDVLTHLNYTTQFFFPAQIIDWIIFIRWNNWSVPPCAYLSWMTLESAYANSKM